MTARTARRLAIAATALLLWSCGPAGSVPTPTTTPTTAPTPSPAVQYGTVWLARDLMAPIPAMVPGAGIGNTIEDRVRSRLETLAHGDFVVPAGAANVVPLATVTLADVRVEGDLVTLDYTVHGDWGLGGTALLRAYVQQIVYTATEERALSRVLITQDGGRMAIIGGEGLTIDHPVRREDVAEQDRDHGVVYFARDRLPPVMVFAEGAGLGATREERIRSRLEALAAGPTPAIAEAFNVVPSMKARLYRVIVDMDLVTIDYAVPEGDWGIDGAAMIEALVQQLVWTASEEPGIHHVLITQNLGGMAIIGGEGLVVAPGRQRQLSFTGPQAHPWLKGARRASRLHCWRAWIIWRPSPMAGRMSSCSCSSRFRRSVFPRPFPRTSSSSTRPRSKRSWGSIPSRSSASPRSRRSSPRRRSTRSGVTAPRIFSTATASVSASARTACGPRVAGLAATAPGPSSWRE
jgi:spore germination protein GerM